MEQDMENNVHEDSVMLFDDRMLSKLRGCNIVPRSPSDFQIFVKSLAGDTISDVVIQEAWKQIYPGYASSPTPERDSDLQELTLNKSSKSEGNVADSLPEFSKFSPGEVPNQKHGSHSGARVFKKTKQFSCESGVKMSDLDKSLSEMGTRHSIGNQSDTLHSVTPVSRKINRTDKCSKQALEELKQLCAKKSYETSVPLEGDHVQEQNSRESDCEIIEIVSLDSSGANNSQSSLDVVSNNGGNKSDSDESVEILDSSENGVDKGIKRLCPIHRRLTNNTSQHYQEKNCCSKQKSVHVSTDSAKSKENVSCEESINKGKQQKVKRGRKRKYKMLRSEIKHLKSVLLNLLLSLKCSVSTDSEESSRNLDNMGFKLVNGKKAGSNESFGPKQSRKKTGSKSATRISSTEKLHASAFVEVNMSRKTRELSPTKKHTEENCEQPPIVMDLDSDNGDSEKRKKFLWRENIVYVLRSKPGKWMSVEKLKRIVIARYYYSRGNVSDNTTVKFFRYLHSTAGVIVEGDMAIYSSEPIIKVSSKTERKQFVLKSHKTTKEYKVS